MNLITIQWIFVAIIMWSANLLDLYLIDIFDIMDLIDIFDIVYLIDIFIDRYQIDICSMNICGTNCLVSKSAIA